MTPRFHYLMHDLTSLMDNYGFLILNATYGFNSRCATIQNIFAIVTVPIPLVSGIC